VSDWETQFANWSSQPPDHRPPDHDQFAAATPGLGAGVGLQGSNADQIKDLNGAFCTAGFSAGVPCYGGADFSWGTDSQGRPVYVGELSGGVGAEGFPVPAAEVHGGVSDTWSASFSIPKVWNWLTNLFD
jgi:hypothetical protein